MLVDLRRHRSGRSGLHRRRHRGGGGVAVGMLGAQLSSSSLALVVVIIVEVVVVVGGFTGGFLASLQAGCFLRGCRRHRSGRCGSHRGCGRGPRDCGNLLRSLSVSVGS